MSGGTGAEKKQGGASQLGGDQRERGSNLAKRQTQQGAGVGTTDLMKKGLKRGARSVPGQHLRLLEPLT